MGKCKNLSKKLISLVLGLAMLSSMFAMVVNAQNHYYVISLEDSCIYKIEDQEEVKLTKEIDLNNENIYDYTDELICRGEIVFVKIELVEFLQNATDRESSEYGYAAYLAALLSMNVISFYAEPETRRDLRVQLQNLAKMT